MLRLQVSPTGAPSVLSAASTSAAHAAYVTITVWTMSITNTV